MSPISTAVRSSGRRRLAAGVLAGSLSVALAGVGVLAAVPAHAAEAGGQGTGDSLFPNVGNTGYDVEHYDIDLAYDHATGAIDATTAIQSVTTAELSSFSLDLEGLDVESILVDGVPATFARTTDAATTTYKLVVTPVAPVSGSFTTVVEYSGVPVSHTDPDGSSEGWVATPDGATAVSEPVGAMTWFPNNNTPLDKATFDIDLTVPTTIDGGAAAAVSNGELIARTADAGAGTTTWSWRQREPMTTYLSLASIGRFDIYESEITLPSGRTIPEWSFIDSDLEAESSTEALASRAEIGPVLGWLEERYGAYPGNSTGILVDDVGLGYALETQDRPFFDGSADRGTLIHELVHQWYGNAVTLSDWSDIWLNEGPAEHITVQATDALFGGDDSETVYFEEWSAVAADDPAWTTPVAGFDDAAELFGFQAYSRSAMALEALRLSIGEDDFLALFREWFIRFDGSDGSTADFTSLAEEVSGEDLDAFFQDWLFDLDKPAWPNVWTLDVAADPVSGTEVERGDAVGYTLSAANTGLGVLAGATATVDLSGVLTSAELEEPLAGGLALDGTTLTWTVPEVAAGAAAASVSFAATVSQDASTGPLALTAGPVGLGATCIVCEVSHPVEAYPIDVVGEASISGVAAVGETLTALPGTWSPGTTFAYEWFRFTAEDVREYEEATGAPVDIGSIGRPVAGAAGDTYTVQRDDLGYAFFVVVTGSRPGSDEVSSVSGPTAYVTASRPVVTPTPTPTSGASGSLAATGTDGAPMFAAAFGAALLVAAGAGAVVASRRRRSTR